MVLFWSYLWWTIQVKKKKETVLCKSLNQEPAAIAKACGMKETSPLGKMSHGRLRDWDDNPEMQPQGQKIKLPFINFFRVIAGRELRRGLKVGQGGGKVGVGGRILW